MPRAFLVDPMCVLDYGHNPQSLVYFGRFLESRGFHVSAHVCQYFPLPEGPYADFVRAFDYYYQDFVPLKGKTVAAPAGSLDGGGDPLERLAIADFRRWLSDVDPGPEDLIFYPSVDYYGAAGLLQALRDRPVERRPRLHLRFIGVMENATKARADVLRYFRLLLERLSDPRVTVSAESPVYAQHLAQTLRRPVSYTLYPLHPEDDGGAADRDEFVVYSAGSGRGDKGFFRLLPIAVLYRKLFPADRVKFLVQNLPRAEETAAAGYVSQLYAAPNVELIAATQTDKGMAAAYRRSNCLIMPYDFEIYRYRGSAVFMEGVAKRKPFVMSAGTGFHPLVEQLPAAFNCTTDEQFCLAIHRLYAAEPAELQAATKRTAETYALLASEGLDSVLSTKKTAAQ